jgi:sugar transferase/CoA-binding protein
VLVDEKAASGGQGPIPAPHGDVVPLPGRSPERRARTAWARGYAVVLAAVEAFAAAVVGTGVVLTRPEGLPPAPSLLWAAVALVPAWPLLLWACGAHAERVFGTGSDEYRTVGRAGLLLLAVAGFVSYAADLDLSRALVVVGVPALTVTTLVWRYAARCHLRRLRARGRCGKRVIVVGRGSAVMELADRLRRENYAGLDVIGLCVTPGDRARVAGLADVPVEGLDDVVSMAARLGADTIAVTSASETAAQYLRRLSWRLEGSGVELLVSPGLIEVAGPRLHIRPFEGLPLLSVEQPRFEGWRRMVKGAVDRSAAALALLVLAPALAAIALAVRSTSSGPVLYRQERVGMNGRVFTMLKFRSMVADADQRLEDIRADNIAGSAGSRSTSCPSWSTS